jgi:type I site-specific restriction endonuclease
MEAQTPPGRDPTPEARARQIIDAALTAAGWIVQERDAVTVRAGPGMAVGENRSICAPAVPSWSP